MYMTYATEDMIVNIYFTPLSGVFARRLSDGTWAVKEVMYQPEAQPLGTCMWYCDAPDLYNPITGEKLVAVRGVNSAYAIVNAESPTDALAAFERVFQEALNEED